MFRIHITCLCELSIVYYFSNGLWNNDIYNLAGKDAVYEAEIERIDADLKILKSQVSPDKLVYFTLLIKF